MARGDGGGHHHGGRGHRMRRGMVQNLVLVALLEGPTYGYELMSRMQQSSGGTWRPSPGSVYPLLQMFEEGGLVESREADGRRVYALTEAGREQASGLEVDTSSASGIYPAGSPQSELREETQRVQGAARQVNATASPEQIQRAVAIVRDARKALYRLLAE